MKLDKDEYHAVTIKRTGVFTKREWTGKISFAQQVHGLGYLSARNEPEWWIVEAEMIVNET